MTSEEVLQMVKDRGCGLIVKPIGPDEYEIIEILEPLVTGESK